jgi:hypothetical protein
MTQIVVPKATVIISHKYGKLGNRLFLGAHFMVNASRHGYILHYPAFEEYAESYEGSRLSILASFPPPPHRRKFVGGFFRKIAFLIIKRAARPAAFLGCLGLARIVIGESGADKKQACDLNAAEFISLLESRRLIFVKGWDFRDGEDGAPYFEKIRSYFKPVDDLRLPAEAVVKKAREKAKLVVGLHIRQGDYRQWESGCHFFETTYYVGLMKAYAAGKSGPVAFLVSSDQPMNPSDFEGLMVVFATGNPVSDMHALSLCDRIIGPLSTFSGWASFYGQVPLYFVSGKKEISDADFSVRNII